MLCHYFWRFVEMEYYHWASYLWTSRAWNAVQCPNTQYRYKSQIRALSFWNLTLILVGIAVPIVEDSRGQEMGYRPLEIEDTELEQICTGIFRLLMLILKIFENSNSFFRHRYGRNWSRTIETLQASAGYCASCSGLVHVWFRFGSNMVQIWFRLGSDLV